MIEQQTAPSRGRGRPRDAETDRAILGATWRVLAEKGYDGLTFDAVAETAGCSRTTLYRRFSSKIELVEAMLFETSRGVEPVLPADADPRAALVAHASALALFLGDERGRAMLTIIESASRTPDLHVATLRHMVGEREFYYAALRRLTAGPQSEERLSFIFDTLVGGIVYHIAIRRQALTPTQIEALVDSAIALLDRRW